MVAAAQAGAVSSEGRCDPAAGCRRPRRRKRGQASPSLPGPRYAGPLGQRFGAPLRCTPWHRRPSYDLCRAPCEHPDFTDNALRGGLVQGFPSVTETPLLCLRPISRFHPRDRPLRAVAALPGNIPSLYRYLPSNRFRGLFSLL